LLRKAARSEWFRISRLLPIAGRDGTLRTHAHRPRATCGPRRARSTSRAASRAT
jgi:D-alanyl-D-alanine carboxypeptidase